MKRKVEKDYERALDTVIDELFNAAADIYGWTWTDFAREAKVSRSTVDNMGTRKTRFPEYRTVWRLAKAVGMEVRLSRIANRRKVA